MESPEKIKINLEDVEGMKAAAMQYSIYIVGSVNQLNDLREKALKKIEANLRVQRILRLPDGKKEIDDLIEQYHKLMEIHDTALAKLSIY